MAAAATKNQTPAARARPVGRLAGRLTTVRAFACNGEAPDRSLISEEGAGLAIVARNFWRPRKPTGRTRIEIGIIEENAGGIGQGIDEVPFYVGPCIARPIGWCGNEQQQKKVNPA